MDKERLGRVVAVALLALLTPVACAALGVGTPSVSGLPSSSGRATPAARPADGEEASTAEAPVNTILVHTGLWAAPVSHHLVRHASEERVRVTDHTTALGPATSTTRGDARRDALPPHAVTRPE
jgi:hypothetical protein